MPVCRECFNYKTNIQSQKQLEEDVGAAETKTKKDDFSFAQTIQEESNEIGTEPEDIEADADSENRTESDVYYSAHEEASSDEAEGTNSAQIDEQNLPSIDQLNLSPPVIKFGA